MVGHQIPAWYNAEGEMYVGEEAPEGDGWTQDEDVLDTGLVQHYGHSQQWVAWLFRSRRFQKILSKLNSSYWICYYSFWVSRMIFKVLSLQVEVHLKNVLIHGLIRDEQGCKCLNGSGNGIDPMDVIEKYGADALLVLIKRFCTWSRRSFLL